MCVVVGGPLLFVAVASLVVWRVTQRRHARVLGHVAPRLALPRVVDGIGVWEPSPQPSPHKISSSRTGSFKKAFVADETAPTTAWAFQQEDVEATGLRSAALVHPSVEQDMKVECLDED
jgi:hypothetical protein